LTRRHGVLVQTAVVLLRKSAEWPELNGVFQRGFPSRPAYLTFQYQVVRVWEIPPETLLGGGLGILPLAPLGAVTEAELPGVIRRMEERIRNEATADEAGTLWTAADVLMGLRYPRDLVAQLMRGVHGMKDSVTYQAIVEEGEVKGRAEGRVEARRDDLLLLGRRRFGDPSASADTALRNITDADRLARMIAALLDASSWDELLATP
jgi:predicted transposase YdaD